ncbi:MAG TPA: hypothetical protein DCE41_32525 [Cytophagales bacterium]|nr:hypothetical protein [Cytophagales bacterium]HAA17956.1 hypothetical protein [Cytophagales bacterium]HAP64839.1 hypothetical protein [Cytophagales bacterium]
MPTLYAWTLDSLVPPDSMLINPDMLSVDFVKEVVQVSPYRGDWLVAVSFTPYVMGKSGVQLFWVTADYAVKESAWLPGNRYEPGGIKVKRWDADTLDDIQYWLELPITTASSIVVEEQIYQFREGEGLVKLFAIEREVREGWMPHRTSTYFLWQYYDWRSEDVLEVTHKQYTFPKGNFKWCGRIIGLQWVQDSTYQLRRNPKTLVFE